MIQEQTLQNLRALPPVAQQVVADFIAFLQIRYAAQPQPLNSIPASNLSTETFVGMWHEHPDMQDSHQWLREIRQHEWGHRNETIYSD